MKTLIINASPRENSHSRVLADKAAKYLKEQKKEFEVLDLSETPMEYFRGFGEDYDKNTKDAISKVRNADAIIISTPIYNSSYSSVLKNLFEHSNYKLIKGKVAGFIINGGTQTSFENVQTQLNSMLNYFDIFSNPKAVFVYAKDAFDDKKELVDESIEDRIKDLVDSTLEICEKLKK